MLTLIMMFFNIDIIQFFTMEVSQNQFLIKQKKANSHETDRDQGEKNDEEIEKLEKIQTQKKLQNPEQITPFSEYMEQIGKKLPKWEKQEIKKKLSNHLISYSEKFEQKAIKNMIREHGNSYVFKVYFGQFQFDVSLIKLNISSNTFERKKNFEGAYSEIFTASKNMKKYAIKSQKQTKKDSTSLNQSLDVVLKQYVLFKLAEVFQFGPKLINYYGFDIVCFDDSIQFSMQLCENYSMAHSETFKQLKEDMLENLKTMHSLQFVHLDIKDSNIAWSPSFKKWIFLDFGFAMMLQEKPGEKTKTKFIGTYNFCIKQMQSLFHLKKLGYVDLYANDFHGLQLVINMAQQKQKTMPESYFLEQGNPVKIYLFASQLLCLKKQVFLLNYAQIEEMLLKNINLRKQFLSLLIYEVEQLSRIKKVEASQQISKIYSKFSKFSENESKIVRNFEKLFLDKKAETVFIKIIENSADYMSITLYEKSQNDLVSYIQQNWGNLEFIKQLLFLISVTVFSNSKHLLEKLKNIIKIIAKQTCPEIGKKSWFYIFRSILLKIESILISCKCFHPLCEIRFIYEAFNDLRSAERINQFMVKNTSNQNKNRQKSLSMFFQFLFRATFIHSLTQLTNIFNQFTEINHKVQRDSMQDKLINIMKLILTIIKKGFINYENQLDLCEQISQLTSQTLYKSSDLIAYIIFKIEFWEQKFIFPYSCEIPTTSFDIVSEATLSETQNKFLTFHYFLFELQKQTQPSITLLDEAFNLYPILKEVPRFFNFHYHLIQGDHEKANEVFEDIIYLKTHSLETMTNILMKMRKKQPSIEKEKEYAYIILNKFLQSYQVQMQKRDISLYWPFYFRFISFLSDQQNSLKEHENQLVKNSISHITQYFQERSQIIKLRYHIVLFKSLNQFLKGQTDKAINLLIEIYRCDELKSEISIELEFLFTLVFYFRQVIPCNALRLEFFSMIEQKDNINWYFYQLPELLREYARGQSHNKMYNIFRNFTFYLYHLNLVGLQLSLIFQEYIYFCEIEQLEQLGSTIIKRESLKIIRENNHLSAFIGCLFLKIVAQGCLNTLQLKRLLILALISINRFGYSDRIWLRSKLVGNLKILTNPPESIRKRMVLSRRISYSTYQASHFKFQAERKLSRLSKRAEIIYCNFFNKLRIIQNNCEYC